MDSAYGIETKPRPAPNANSANASMPHMEVTKQMDANAQAASNLLGRAPEWWDAWMLISLGLAAVAAVAVLLFTAGSLVSNKRAAFAAEQELERYKTETAGRVAAASAAGLLAGEKAAKAQLDVAEAQVRIAETNERASQLSKEAAAANLKAERLKQAVAWREIDTETAKKLVHILSKHKGSINLRYSDGDPEALYLAVQYSHIFAQAGWGVAFGATKFADSIVFGVFVVPNADGRHQILANSLQAAKISFSVGELPPPGVEFNVSRIGGAPTLMIGSRRPHAL